MRQVKFHPVANLGEVIQDIIFRPKQPSDVGQQGATKTNWILLSLTTSNEVIGIAESDLAESRADGTPVLKMRGDFKVVSDKVLSDTGTGLSAPGGLAIHKDLIYVADNANNRIVRLDFPTNVEIDINIKRDNIVPLERDEPTALRYPADINFLIFGKMVIADVLNRRIVRGRVENNKLTQIDFPVKDANVNRVGNVRYCSVYGSPIILDMLHSDNYLGHHGLVTGEDTLGFGHHGLVTGEDTLSSGKIEDLKLNLPQGIEFRAGTCFISDWGNNRLIAAKGDRYDVLSGQGFSGGPFMAGEIYRPTSVTFSKKRMYVASDNGIIYRSEPLKDWLESINAGDKD